MMSQAISPRWYVDTSAALKLLIEETESPALTAELAAAKPALASARLLETELRRAAHRIPELQQDRVTALLELIDIYEMPASLFRQAGLIAGPNLRSLDALHLTAAIAVDAEAIATYDTRLSEAAATVGLAVIAPGAR